MKHLFIYRSILLLSLTLIALVWPVLAQSERGKQQKPSGPSIIDEKRPAGKINISIAEVVKEDANAKPSGSGRAIPVRFVWLCGSTNNAKLLTLEAKLVTLNTDGKSTTVTKKLVDWTVNKPITSLLELPMPKDVFAKNFTLELVGKFTDGKAEHLVSARKQGNFPVPSLAERKSLTEQKK